MLSQRLIYLHAHAPPTPGGTPVLIHRLLSGLDPDELEVVTEASLRPMVLEGGPRVLQARYHFVPRKGPNGNRYAAGRLLNATVNGVLAVAAGLRAAALARQRRAGWILTVSDEGFSVIAGAVSARTTGLPHIVMIFDLWEENAYTDVARAMARVLEPRILRSAALVLVHNDEMAEHYRAKHGISCAVLPTSVEPWDPVASPPRPEESVREILFAGAVYWAQEEALRRLSRVPENSTAYASRSSARDLTRRLCVREGSSLIASSPTCPLSDFANDSKRPTCSSWDSASTPRIPT